jgi:hypothetical protein
MTWADATFVPTIEATKQVWPFRRRIVAAERDLYPTEEAAIEAAAAQGMEWVIDDG